MDNMSFGRFCFFVYVIVMGNLIIDFYDYLDMKVIIKKNSYE